MEFNQLLDQYDYSFPEHLIAQAPASPRDTAKLLVYDRKSGEISLDTFLHLPDYLPENAVVVFNQTKVLPARITVRKPTGGKVVLLYTGTNPDGVLVLSDRKLEVGTQLHVNAKYSFVVGGKREKQYVLKPNFPLSQIKKMLDENGVMPLPPYIKHTPLSHSQQSNQYQTVFAKKPGAVAAPTASLHFTKRLLAKLRKNKITTAFVTLHVGLGTFASLTEDQVRSKALHYESYEIDHPTAKLLNSAKKQGRPIIAVGTTVVRTLESASNDTGVLTTLSGATNLFIQEKTPLKFVDCLITNFHVPKSSLLMLVSAFVGREKLLALYGLAIRKKFRLFSFGDGMLVK